MATEEQKNAIARRFVTAVHVGERQTAQVNMDDLRDAAGEAFDWIESVQGAYNGFLPQPFRGVATVKQKAQLLTYAIEVLVGKI